jgi:hypothetical protein
MDDARGITLWMMVQRKASIENYMADDDGCGDIDSGTGGTYSVVSYRHGKKTLTRRQLWPCAFREYPTKENPNTLEYSE